MRRAPVRSFRRRGFTSPDERARMKRSVDVSGKGRAPDRLAVNRVIVQREKNVKNVKNVDVSRRVLGRARCRFFPNTK